MDRSQARDKVLDLLREIIPEIRTLNSSAIHGQSVAELRWKGETRYLPLVDNAGGFNSSQIN